MNVDTGLCHCSNWQSKIPFRVYLVLDPQAFVHFVRLILAIAPMTRVSDDHGITTVPTWSSDQRSLTLVIMAVAIVTWWSGQKLVVQAQCSFSFCKLQLSYLPISHWHFCQSVGITKYANLTIEGCYELTWVMPTGGESCTLLHYPIPIIFVHCILAGSNWGERDENATMDVWSDTQRQVQKRTHPRNNDSGAGLQKDHGDDWTSTSMRWGEMKNAYWGKCWQRIYHGKGRDEDWKQDGNTCDKETCKILCWEPTRRRTGRCGEGRSSVTPATLHDGKSQGKRRRRSVLAVSCVHQVQRVPCMYSYLWELWLWEARQSRLTHLEGLTHGETGLSEWALRVRLRALLKHAVRFSDLLRF